MADGELELPEWFSRLDFGAIEDSSSKLAECEYFLGLASAEIDRARFRWLVSAFFGAAYSFFEMSALHAYFAFTSPDTGEPEEDSDALVTLRAYVKVERHPRKPSYVKTEGKHLLIKRLYELRRENTHHFPLAVMAAGPSLPEDFHICEMRERGIPALAFCRQAMSLMHQVQRELSQ